MSIGRNILSATLAFSLVACGGESGSNAPTSTATPTPTPTSAPTPTPTVAACSLSARQDFALAVLDQWYLFPELLDKTVNKSSHATVESYIDALVAPARAQSKDRYFTYITSIAEENAFYNSGSSAGFGMRLGYDTTANRVFVIESFETAPALTAGIDRGTEILQIGTSAGTLENISTIMASEGPQGVVKRLGEDTAGLQRVFEVRPLGGTQQQIPLSKADYSLDSVSDRYGFKIIKDGTKKVGYVNLRTFISNAKIKLGVAFLNFRVQGVDEVIIDLRYNGGGLVSIAELMGDLMGRDKVGQVFSQTTLRPSKSSENSTTYFSENSSAIAPTKIAIIGRGGTASASELVANAFIPYMGNNMALIGTNTYGKPVGQYAFDKEACDDRMRVVTFKTVNRDGRGDYFTGLAPIMPNTCTANDDISRPLGDPNEASIAQALSFLRNGAAACTPISSSKFNVANATSATGAQQRTLPRPALPERQLLQPDRPSPAQREVPGLF